MNADLFLCTFLGCLFAIGAVAVAIWQFAAWKIRRIMKRDTAELLDLAIANPQFGPEIIAAVHRASIRRKHDIKMASAQHGTHIATAKCFSCEVTCGIPDCQDGIDMLNDLGWRHTKDALYCATCAKSQPEAQTL
jgi:hypothetical protein